MDICAYLTLFSLKSPHILVSVFESVWLWITEGVHYIKSQYLMEEDSNSFITLGLLLFFTTLYGLIYTR